MEPARAQSAERLRDAWALVVVLASAAAFACTELSDGDLGFHLATGREVLATGRIPSSNVLSYTNPEHPWLLHQWLPGVLFELIHRELGVPALQLLRVLLVGGTWAAVYRACRLGGATPEVAGLATLLGESAAAFRFQLRPYLFTHLSLALVLAASAAFLRARERGDGRAGRRALVLGALVAAAAAHTHAGVIDSWLVFVALGVGCAVEPIWARITGNERPVRDPWSIAHQVALALVGSIALAAITLALYHPYGARILLFPFDMGSDAYLADHLIEFRPPWAFPFTILAAYWATLTLCLLALVLRVRAIHAFWCAVMLGFMLLSLKHVRLAYGFAVAAAPFLAVSLSPWLSGLRPSVLALVLTVAAPLSVLQRYELDPPGMQLAQRTWPSYLFAYLETHALDGRAFVSDAWAAPLLGRSYPARKAFFDNRFEAYPRDFFVEVYQHVRYGLPGWDQLLDRYGVELVLMRYTTPGEAERQGHKPNLRQHLARDPRWTLVTFDDLGELFVRTRGKHASHAATHGLSALDPDAARFMAPPRTTLAALERELQRGNPSARARVFAAHAALDAGDHARAMHWGSEAARIGEPSAMPLVLALRERLLSGGAPRP